MTQKSIYREQFKIHLQRLGYSKSSQYMIPACIAEFLGSLEDKGIYEVQQIKPEHIQEHYQYLTQRPNKVKPGGLSSVMINHHIYAIRLFLNYQEQIGIITDNPISGLYFPKPQSNPREILTIEEIKYLYQTIENYRDKAIVGLFYGCGLRRSEGVALNLKDISFKSLVLYVRDGKGNKRRVVPVSERVIEDFKNYLYHERKANQGEIAFITNSHGTRTLGNGYHKALKKILIHTGIEKEICLHGLRHSIATHLLENGMPFEYVRDFLGHKFIQTTQTYTRISKKQLSAL